MVGVGSFSGGAGGGALPDDEPRLARDPVLTPHTFGPLPLLDLPLQALFVEHLAQHGNVRLACKAARVSAQTAYRMRRASATFRALWNAALVVARDQVEDVLADRAVHGWDEAVYYHGEEVGSRRRYDSRLLLAHLGRLDKLAEREGAALMMEHFDDAVAAMSAGEAPVFPPDPAATSAVPVAEEAPLVAGAGLVAEIGAVAEIGDQDEHAEADGVPLLEARLLWLEAHHGELSEEEEAFHLLNTVPGVPGCALRRFGWRGSDGELTGLEPLKPTPLKPIPFESSPSTSLRMNFGPEGSEVETPRTASRLRSMRTEAGEMGLEERLEQLDADGGVPAADHVDALGSGG
ncbi:MAG: hypothetical protein ABIT10_11945 [Alteraurantiacibacter sp.]